VAGRQIVQVASAEDLLTVRVGQPHLTFDHVAPVRTGPTSRSRCIRPINRGEYAEVLFSKMYMPMHVSLLIRPRICGNQPRLL
jgi:hypothetical protein